MTLSEDQQADRETAMETIANTTRRAISPGAERNLYREHRVLDHGFVRLVDYMGSDSAIVQAARVSYGEGTKTVSSDEGLIRYLMRHKHTSPFEMCEIKLHVKLPIFVARQWIRHRTANVNEYSARYSILDKEFYFPDAESVASQSASNHQGRGERIDRAQARKFTDLLKSDCDRAYENYEQNLSDTDGSGLAREIARIGLPINIYTQWYWKVDLHNLLHFIALRSERHSQFEIREYASLIGEIVKDWVPMAWKAFSDYRINAASLSALEIECVRKLAKGREIAFESSGMSRREWREFNAIIDNQ